MKFTSKSRPKNSPEIRRFTFFWPFAILMFCLIFSTGNDLLTIHKQKAAMFQENQQYALQLKSVGDQAQFIENLRKELQKISSSNPAVARIVKEFFPAPPPPAKKDPLTPAKKPPAATTPAT